MSGMKFLLLLLLAVPAFAQLPDRGSPADLVGKTKVYIIADGDYYKAIEKNLDKRFVEVPKAVDAEFFLEYKTLSRSHIAMTGATMETGQLEAYISRDKQKVVAWSDSLTGGGFKGDAAGKLAKRFNKIKP